MALLGLLLAYVACYVLFALVLLRLLIGESPDLVVPGSRSDWHTADMPRNPARLRALLGRLAARSRTNVVARRPVDLDGYDRSYFMPEARTVRPAARI
jgi:hypothetical protein